MKVRTKLGLLLFLVVGIFIGGLGAIKVYDRNRFREATTARQLERRQSFDDFIVHWSQPLDIFVRYSTTWDGMVSAVANKDGAWADTNLSDNALATYHAHVVWAYGMDGALAFTRNLLYSDTVGTVPIPKDALQRIVSGGRPSRFFAWTPLGLLEISGASIHATRDTTRALPPQGYFFAARLWSSTDLREMSLFTGNSLQLVKPEQLVDAATPNDVEQSPVVNFTRALPGWDGSPVATLVVRSDSPVMEQLRRSNDRQFYHLIFFSVVLFLVLVLSLTRWVSHPLNRLSAALGSERVDKLQYLQGSKDEFGELAQMIMHFFDQRQRLVDEMTERRQTQEKLQESEERLRQSQKMEAIGRLAGGVAHDFNNLLTAIIGYAELIQLRTKEETTREEAELIRQAGDQAADLTKQLLAFSRKQILQPRVLDLNALVQNMQKLLRRVIGEDIELRLEIGTEWARVNADPTQLEQVLLNLAVNARDAMPRGGVLTMRTGEVLLTEPLHGSTSLLPGRYLTLSVQDTGCGMDADTQARIFEPFFTTKGPGKGTGLGLATVYGVVQQSGGAIFVHSEVGEGATFTVYLPNAELPLDAPAPEPLIFEKVERQVTVLVVEDEVIVRELVCAVLSEDGFQVLSAGCGADAIALANEFHGEIALLVSDVVMPQMTGPECARELLRTRPDMKVLFVSGYSEADISEDGVLSLGVNLLPKPFTPKVLSERVHQMLSAVVVATS